MPYTVITNNMQPTTPQTVDEARQHAIDWQQWASEQDLSYAEVNEWAFHFYAIAENFPSLKDEFIENCII